MICAVVVNEPLSTHLRGMLPSDALVIVALPHGLDDEMFRELSVLQVLSARPHIVLVAGLRVHALEQYATIMSQVPISLRPCQHQDLLRPWPVFTCKLSRTPPDSDLELSLTLIQSLHLVDQPWPDIARNQVRSVVDVWSILSGIPGHVQCEAHREEPSAVDWSNLKPDAERTLKEHFNRMESHAIMDAIERRLQILEVCDDSATFRRIRRAHILARLFAGGLRRGVSRVRPCRDVENCMASIYVLW
jgi:hypothetical protein